MLEFVSEKLMNYFDRKISLSESERLKLFLGFEGIIHQCLLTAVIFSIAGILHIFVPVLLFFIVFGSFRIAAGGLHLNTSLKCTVATTSIMIFGTKAALAISLNLGISVIIFALVLWIVFMCAPRKSGVLPGQDGTFKKQKAIAWGIAFCWGILALIDPWNIREIILAALAGEALTLIPPARRDD